MIIVVGDVAGLVVINLAGNMRKRVPDRRSAAVGRRSALNLIRSRRAAPKEAAGEFIKIIARLSLRLRLLRCDKRGRAGYRADRRSAESLSKVPPGEMNRHRSYYK